MSALLFGEAGGCGQRWGWQGDGSVARRMSGCWPVYKLLPEGNLPDTRRYSAHGGAGAGAGARGQRWETRQSMFACLSSGLFLPGVHVSRAFAVSPRAASAAQKCSLWSCTAGKKHLRRRWLCPAPVLAGCGCCSSVMASLGVLSGSCWLSRSRV